MTDVERSIDSSAPTRESQQVPPAAVDKSRTLALWKWATRLGLLLGFLLGWQLASGTIIDTFLVSTPLLVFERFGKWIADGTLWFHAVETLESAMWGFVIGGSAALIVGYLAGVSRFWASVIEPYISATWSMPRIAFIPVLIIWVGIAQSLAVAIAAILVFFLLFYNIYYGIREVNERLIDSVRLMGGGRYDVAVRVRLPSALVWILAGLKVSIPQAFVGVVTAEILASNRGLGYLVARHGGQFDMTGAFAALLSLLIVGFALDRFVSTISGRALLWKGNY